MKLLNTKSIIRYLPPKGTAGLARSLVSGASRVPLPPARTMPNTRIRIIGFMSYCSRVRGVLASTKSTFGSVSRQDDSAVTDPIWVRQCGEGGAQDLATSGATAKVDRKSTRLN